MKGLLDMTIDELESRLDNEFSDIYKCVLIKGEWGIGKTYLYFFVWIRFYRRNKNRNLF